MSAVKFPTPNTMQENALLTCKCDFTRESVLGQLGSLNPDESRKDRQQVNERNGLITEVTRAKSGHDSKG
jgi:hypothetical protein